MSKKKYTVAEVAAALIKNTQASIDADTRLQRRLDDLESRHVSLVREFASLQTEVARMCANVRDVDLWHRRVEKVEEDVDTLSGGAYWTDASGVRRAVTQMTMLHMQNVLAMHEDGDLHVSAKVRDAIRNDMARRCEDAAYEEEEEKVYSLTDKGRALLEEIKNEESLARIKEGVMSKLKEENFFTATKKPTWPLPNVLIHGRSCGKTFSDSAQKKIETPQEKTISRKPYTAPKIWRTSKVKVAFLKAKQWLAAKKPSAAEAIIIVLLSAILVAKIL